MPHARTALVSFHGHVVPSVAAERLEDVDLAEWDRLLGPGAFYLSSGWLAVAAETAGAPPVHLVARVGRSAVGVLPCYPLDERSQFVFCRPDRLLADLLEQRGVAAPGWLSNLLPCLFCGGRHPAHTGPGLAGHLAPGERASAARWLLGAALDEARRRSLACVTLPYVDETDLILRSVLEGLGFLRLRSDVASVLEVTGSTFDDYLRSLGPKRARTARRECRRLHAAGVRFTVRALDRDLAEVLLPMQRNLLARYGRDADPDHLRRLHVAIAGHLPGQATVFLAELTDICGFVLAFHWRDELHLRDAGFDYDRQGRLPLYFGLAYYEPVEHALRSGIRRLYYSTGAADTKRSRGCAQVGQLAYVRCLDPALHEELRRLVAQHVLP